MIDAHGVRTRARVLAAVRGWFHAHGYLEVPTPAMVASPAMEEHLHAIPAGDQWLRTSPEFSLKRAIAAGLHRVYEIGPCFRDREKGPWHAREFTMIEWYRAHATLGELMQDVTDLVETAARAIDRPAPSHWRRVTVRQLFKEVAGLDLATATAQDLSATDHGWDDAFFRRWVEDIEPTLQGAVFVEDWPASQAALARIRDTGDWPVACRFEAYLGGIELANAFLELTDATEQRRRFAASNQARAASGESPHPIDPDFVDAVGRMPTTVGIAMGLDRLVASLAGWDHLSPGRV